MNDKTEPDLNVLMAQIQALAAERTKKFPVYVVIMCIVLSLWGTQGLIINFWGFVQSTLIAQSQLGQQAQQSQQRAVEAEKQLAIERAKGPAAKVEEKK